MPEISLIVPVFNSSEYLEECLESIINQTFTGIEIICINDGSTDESLEILKAYGVRDSRFVIVDQPNQGVSAARNAGLEVASGNFIGFLDSDDRIFPEYLSILYHLIHQSELSVCGYIGNNKMSFPDEDIDLKVTDFQNLAKLLDTGLLYSPWGKLYRSEIITKHEIKFPKNINYGEDLLFNLQYLNLIQKISVTSEILYKYNVSNLQSLAKTYSIKRFIDTNFQIGKIEDFLQHLYSDRSKTQKYIAEKLYWNTYDACFYLQNNFGSMEKSEALNWIKSIIKFPFFALKTDHATKSHFLVKIFSFKRVEFAYIYLYLRRKLLKY